MKTANSLQLGLEAFRRQAWGEAFAQLQAASRESRLDPEDLEQLAIAAHLVGLDAQSYDHWASAHGGYLAVGDVAAATRCAFWLAFFSFLIHGDPARGAGWLARGQRLLEESDLDCVERGYLSLPVAIRTLTQGDAEAAFAEFDRALSIGERFQDPSLITLGRLGKGQALIRQGRTDEGIGLMDEVMIAVSAGDLSPIAIGVAYCAVIEDCQQLFDLRRAQEWTDLLTHWCLSQPDLVPYRRQCLVHRAEILRFHGAWTEALSEAKHACDLISEIPDSLSTGGAFYERAEIHRLRGEFAEAEEAYREASRLGRTAQPGLALLRLVQGRADTAIAALRREVQEALADRARAPLLASLAEVLVAAGAVEEARSVAEELVAIADTRRAPYLTALAAQTQGNVLLAAGDASAALAVLRRAWNGWHELEAPYEAACVRVLIGAACRGLGDQESAVLELDAARQIFRQLGARPDLEHLYGPSSWGLSPEGQAGLTGREADVLRLLATGKSNHEIAADLVVSDHTVRRHIQNIFAKLGVSSRAAATAYTFRNGLL